MLLRLYYALSNVICQVIICAMLLTYDYFIAIINSLKFHTCVYRPFTLRASMLAFHCRQAICSFFWACLQWQGNMLAEAQCKGRRYEILINY